MPGRCDFGVGSGYWCHFSVATLLGAEPEVSRTAAQLDGESGRDVP